MTNKKTGVLLVNLGSPKSPSNGDVFTYLNEFLTDERVIDIPWLPRQLLVRGIIVPTRYKNSARTYREIWTEKGSPLIAYSEVLTEKIKERLGENILVELAMRYQEPSIDKAMERLQQSGVEKIIVFPLYPQYASASTGSIMQKVMAIVSTWQAIPELSFVSNYYDHPLYIESLYQIGKTYQWQNYDYVLFSYHGLPERQLKKADVTGNHCLKSNDCCEQKCSANALCYRMQCWATTEALAEKLGIPKEMRTFCFQSRLGKEPWLQPFTWEVLEKLAAAGKKKVLVFSPSFVADCLETIYEIKEEYLELFQKHGGEQLQLVESLNTNEHWVNAVESMIRERI
ncbi:MAG: ferrochelatase [Chitinophagales bacterium]|nr:ferrochelatase [Chitinophagales bacterium]